MIPELVVAQYYAFFIMTLIVSFFGAIITLAVDSPQSRAARAGARAVGHPVPEH